MRYISWASENGRTIVFDSAGPFYFKDLSSTLGAAAETVKTPRQDGSTTYYTSLDTRSINLVGGMLVYGDRGRSARVEYDKARVLLHEAFAPNRWGLLTYYKEDEAVWVRCRPVSTPTISAPVGTYSTVDVDFVTDSPYWETALEHVVCIGAIQKFRRFPWTPVKGPMGVFNRFASIQNPTVLDIVPSAEVYSTGQYVTLTNLSTGEHVTIEHAIREDQKLMVDLSDMSAFLWTKNGAGDFAEPEDVSHWMSLDSEPWGLKPGLNQVAITNDVPEDTPVAYVRYRIPSLGV